MAVVLSLLVLLVLATGYLVLKVTSLDSSLSDEQQARTEAENQLTTLKGSMTVLQEDQQAVHRHLDEVAAADPTVIARKVQPSVYTIETSGGSLGSGWVAFSDHTTARFVTNYHVIADAWERGETTVSVHREGTQVYEGTIEQALPDIDLAVVAVAADIAALSQSSETPTAGETIVVIGSALGFDGSVSTGAVSALRDVDGIPMIQFAAPTSPGNSGGPVVNSLGEVIGITTLDFGRVVQGSENAKFAIPVNQVCTRLTIC